MLLLLLVVLAVAVVLVNVIVTGYLLEVWFCQPWMITFGFLLPSGDFSVVVSACCCFGCCYCFGCCCYDCFLCLSSITCDVLHMVPILVGSSERGAHIWTISGFSIC